MLAVRPCAHDNFPRRNALQRLLHAAKRSLGRTIRRRQVARRGHIKSPQLPRGAGRRLPPCPGAGCGPGWDGPCAGGTNTTPGGGAAGGPAAGAGCSPVGARDPDIIVQASGGRLHLFQAGEELGLTFYAETADRFYAEGIDVDLAFHRDAQGRLSFTFSDHRQRTEFQRR